MPSTIRSFLGMPDDVNSNGMLRPVSPRCGGAQQDGLFSPGPREVEETCRDYAGSLIAEEERSRTFLLSY